MMLKRLMLGLSSHKFASLEQFLNKSYAPKLLIMLGLLLVLPSLWAGLFADDYALLLHLKYPHLLASQHYPSVFQLFTFIGQDMAVRLDKYALSLLPWWTSDTTRIVFFRPLAELSHALDASLFAYNRLMMHGQNLLFYALLLVFLYRFYRQILSHRSVAVLALLLFAVDATHGFTVAWIANRNALMAGVFVLAAWHYFFKAGRFYYGLSLLLFMAALLSAELGMSFLLMLVLYYGLRLVSCDCAQDDKGGVQGDKPSVIARAVAQSSKANHPFVIARAVAQSSPRTLKHLLPVVAISVAYLAFYLHYGFGAAGGYYLSPFSNFSGFLQALPERLFTAFSMQFNLLPFHLADRFPKAVALSGLLIALLWLYFAYRMRSRVLWFLLLAFSACSALVAIAVMQERNLLIAGFFGCALLALLIDQLWRRKAFMLANVLLFFHLMVSALTMLPMSYAPALLNKGQAAMAQAMPDWQGEAVISVGAPMFDAAFVNLIRLWQGQTVARRFWNISSRADVEIQLLSANRFIFSDEKGLLQGIDYLLRDNKKPFYTGQTFDLNGAKLVILSINAEHNPDKIQLDIETNYAKPLVIYRWLASEKRWQAVLLDKDQAQPRPVSDDQHRQQ